MTFPKNWIDDLLDASTNPVGTHQIVTLAQGHIIEARKHYATKRAAFTQQTTIMNKAIGAPLNVYVVSHYPEGEVLWCGQNVMLRERVFIDARAEPHRSSVEGQRTLTHA